MPTYDYECTKCGHTFDAFQNMSDDPLRKCPECGKSGLRRLIGGGLGVIFKGSGFYSTDSRSTASKTSSKTSDAKTTTGDDGAASKETTTKKDSDKKPGAEQKKAG